MRIGKREMGAVERVEAAKVVRRRRALAQSRRRGVEFACVYQSWRSIGLTPSAAAIGADFPGCEPGDARRTVSVSFGEGGEVVVPPEVAKELNDIFEGRLRTNAASGVIEIDIKEENR